MRGEEFVSACAEVLGPEWKVRLRDHFGVTQRTVDRWAGGETMVPDYVERWIEDERNTVLFRLPLNGKVAGLLHDARMAVSYWYDEPQEGRWEILDESIPLTESGFPDVGREGCIVWTERFLEAHILSEWYRLRGYVAYIAHDLAEHELAYEEGRVGPGSVWAVFTSAPVEDKSHGE